MIVPVGVNKASGTAEALREVGVSPARCVAVGDAENDLDCWRFAASRSQSQMPSPL